MSEESITNCTPFHGYIFVEENPESTIIVQQQKKIEKLEACIVKLEDKQRWVSVNEKMPPNEVEVFGYFYSKEYYRLDIVVYYAADNIWVADDRVLRQGAVTYWMLIPELPEEV